MPRKRLPPPPSPPAPEPVHVIHPTAVYFREDARRLLRLTPHTLTAELAAGRLRVAKRGKRYYLLGQWLLDWILGGELKRREAPCGAPSNGRAGCSTG